MPLDHTDIQILNFLYSERQRDIYHPPHIDRLVDLTRLPPDQVELIVNLLNIKDYVYTYHSPGPVKITAHGIDFVEKGMACDKLQGIVEAKARIMREIKSVYENDPDRWVTNEHLLQVLGTCDRMHLYQMADYLSQRRLVDLRRRALGSFHMRLSEHGHVLLSSSGEAVCS